METLAVRMTLPFENEEIRRIHKLAAALDVGVSLANLLQEKYDEAFQSALAYCSTEWRGLCGHRAVKPSPAQRVFLIAIADSVGRAEKAAQAIVAARSELRRHTTELCVAREEIVAAANLLRSEGTRVLVVEKAEP